MLSHISLSRRARAGAAGRPLQPVLSRVALTCALVGVLAPAATANTLVGGAGADTLTGNSPSGDLIVGGGGSDTLSGGDGPDKIFGVRSGNRISGGGGDNYLEGGSGDDRITAGNGNNTIYGGTGHDTISAGNGNNYVDPGGAPDEVTLGDGNNVVSGGSGGLKVTIGNGDNVVYLLTGPDEAKLGSGVNQVYVSRLGFASIDCGGNPASTLFISNRADPKGELIQSLVRAGKVKGCPNIQVFPGEKTVLSRQAGVWATFNLIGGEGPDKLFGGHGGGRIDGKGGNNVLWADSSHGTGGARARARTTRITAGNGSNIVYGGRGTNVITLGNGRNFIRGGAWNNTIVTGSGGNTIRLQGKGRNKVTIRGGSVFVESFANGSIKPVITCTGGAKGVVLHGNVKPRSNCGTVVKANSEQGKKLQVQGLELIPDSDPVVATPLTPGAPAGVPRPTVDSLT
ncbi:MAG: calcium-binding protein [Solirubrobacteraceae bacterium]|nr:calcium-binding protein [Solirubrobacteraceae bacterium]